MIIFRYLVRQVYPTMIGVTAILLFAVIFAIFIQLLNSAASGKYSLQMALELTLLDIPLLTGYVMGLGLFVAILLVYSRMYSDSEMTVLFACGYSRTQLIRHTLLYSLLVMIVVGVMSLWVQPRTFYYKGLITAQGKTTLALFSLSQLIGKFQPLPDGRVIYMDEKKRVFLAELPRLGKTSWQVMLAESMDKKLNMNTKEWLLILKNGSFYSGTPGKHEARLGDFKEVGYYIAPEVAVVDANRTRIKSMEKLWKEKKTDLDAMAELQMRLSMPLTIPILVLIAIPLSQVRNRQTKHAGFSLGILLYAAYMISLFVFQNGISKGAAFAKFGLIEAHLVFLGIALILMRIQYKRP